MPPRPFSLLQNEARPFLLALGFLTRLAPAMVASGQEMARACLYFPLAGVVLGALLIAPFSGCPPFFFVLFQGHPLLQAFVYVLLSAFLTRGLHFDGLADVLDAFGSGKTGAEFQAVLTDSRLGAFGALGIALAVSGHCILASVYLAQASLAPLFFAPILGRSLPILLALITPPHPHAGLGVLLREAPQKRCLLVALVTSALAGPLCLGTGPALCAFALAGCFLFALSHLAKTEGGYNGDFCGFLIILGECAALAAPLLLPGT